jgi:hypothetical protein
VGNITTLEGKPAPTSGVGLLILEVVVRSMHLQNHPFLKFETLSLGRTFDICGLDVFQLIEKYLGPLVNVDQFFGLRDRKGFLNQVGWIF